ncbi:MAG: iron transporter [Chloroflexi bacterium]|nr:iron transporter [Chloroflexota bacterium]
MNTRSKNPGDTPTRSSRLTRHMEQHGGGGALSDIILGGQDGLVNVLGVILGLVAATPDPRIIVAGGLAATFAESISMAAVAYTSTLADRDFYRAELERERYEIRELPEAEREEVRQIYRDWGLEGEALEGVVRQITANEETWLQVMMADELKLQPVDEQRVLRSALIVGVAAIIGSLIPLIPFFFLASGLVSRGLSIGISLGVSAVALFLVGVYKARQTVGRPGRSGVQMAVIGIASALAGYGIGTLFGG